MKIDTENIFCHNCKSKLMYQPLRWLEICKCNSLRIFELESICHINFTDLSIYLRIGTDLNYIFIRVDEYDNVQLVFDQVFKNRKFGDYKNFSEIYLEIQKTYNNLIFI